MATISSFCERKVKRQKKYTVRKKRTFITSIEKERIFDNIEFTITSKSVLKMLEFGILCKICRWTGIC